MQGLPTRAMLLLAQQAAKPLPAMPHAHFVVTTDAQLLCFEQENAFVLLLHVGCALMCRPCYGCHVYGFSASRCLDMPSGLLR